MEGFLDQVAPADTKRGGKKSQFVLNALNPGEKMENESSGESHTDEKQIDIYNFKENQ